MEDQNEGGQAGGRGGARSCQVIWGSDQGGLFMHQLPAWDEDLIVTAGASICCGVDLLLVRDTQRVNVMVDASAEWGQALLNGPASFVVWVNLPGTIDFSVGLVAHPWMTIGEQQQKYSFFLLPKISTLNPQPSTLHIKDIPSFCFLNPKP